MEATLRGPRILVVDDDRNQLDKTLATIRTHCASYEAREPSDPNQLATASRYPGASAPPI